MLKEFREDMNKYPRKDLKTKNKKQQKASNILK